MNPVPFKLTEPHKAVNSRIFGRHARETTGGLYLDDFRLHDK
jgi:hypothetical protein